jgi:Flp pilus assembly protein TadD
VKDQDVKRALSSAVKYLRPVIIFAGISLFSVLAYGGAAAGDEAEKYCSDAKALFEADKVEDAIAAMKACIDADPENADALEKLGEMFSRQERYDDAVKAFDSALEINPRLRTAKTGKGIALMKKGDFKEAEVVLKDALVLNPYPSMTHYVLGLIYEKQGHFEKAVSEYRQGIEKYKNGKK